MQLTIDEMSVVFNGILAVASILMLAFITSIVLTDVVSTLKELYGNKKQKKSEYKKGYEDGLRDGLSIANELMDEFMEEHQEKMNRLLFNEEEEL